MSMSNEALQKVLIEIEQKAQFAQQQMTIVKSQMASKNRENRMLQLTSTEINQLPPDAKCYEGVGKMFVAMPTPEVKSKLGKEAEDIKAEIANLEKKLNYLETTYKNSREHIEKIFANGGR